MVLAFLLGIIASPIKSDLKLFPELYWALTIYLLFAIGLKGGAKLVGLSFSDIWLPMTVAIGLSLAILRKMGKFDGVNSAALAAHHGSVLPHLRPSASHFRKPIPHSTSPPRSA